MSGSTPEPSQNAGGAPEPRSTAEDALRAISETLAEHPQNFCGCTVEFDGDQFGFRFTFVHYASLLPLTGRGTG